MFFLKPVCRDSSSRNENRKGRAFHSERTLESRRLFILTSSEQQHVRVHGGQSHFGVGDARTGVRGERTVSDARPSSRGSDRRRDDGRDETSVRGFREFAVRLPGPVELFGHEISLGVDRYVPRWRAGPVHRRSRRVQVR